MRLPQSRRQNASLTAENGLVETNLRGMVIALCGGEDHSLCSLAHVLGRRAAGIRG